jgi:hypothetical protein
MKALRNIVILTGLGIIGYAIYNFYRLQIEFIKNIDYRISKIKVINLSLELLTIEVTVTVYNKSNIDAVIKEMYLDLFLNGVLIGNVQEKTDIEIKSLQSSSVSFRYNVIPSQIFKNITNIINLTLEIKDAIITANGFAKLESGIIKATIPFEYKKSVKEFFKK